MFTNKLKNIDISGKDINVLPTNLPKVVASFNCSKNNLSSLVGSPSRVEGRFSCNHNVLVNLNGGPVEVLGSYSAQNNFLTSLVGSPKIISGDFWIYDNPKLTDVSDIWLIDTIRGATFVHIVDGMAVLPLVKFGLFSGKGESIINLINKHRGVEKSNILDLQYDLMENGYAEHAMWRPMASI